MNEAGRFFLPCLLLQLLPYYRAINWLWRFSAYWSNFGRIEEIVEIGGKNRNRFNVYNGPYCERFSMILSRRNRFHVFRPVKLSMFCESIWYGNPRAVEKNDSCRKPRTLETVVGQSPG